MRLTKNQIELILRAEKDSDYYAMYEARGNIRTMNSLVKKNLAEFGSCFEYKYGTYIKLTQTGRDIREKLVNKL